nr:integrase, catalytic region, zinc finger, CCHC-type, peptidase aspartic, catalytic [Tanacetum cinerariifolium]
MGRSVCGHRYSSHVLQVHRKARKGWVGFGGKVRLFDQDGKLVASSKSESQVDCYNGCSKHMTGNLKLLINFVWKFMGTVRFGNYHVATTLGFGDLQWGNILITRVYLVERLGHNLFSIGQFCDSDFCQDGLPTGRHFY